MSSLWVISFHLICLVIDDKGYHQAQDNEHAMFELLVFFIAFLDLLLAFQERITVVQKPNLDH